MGALATGLTSGAAVDLLWLHNDPGHYAALALRCGWDEEAFHRWLAASMRGALPDH